MLPNEPTVFKLIIRAFVSALALFVLLGLGHIIIKHFMEPKEKGGSK